MFCGSASPFPVQATILRPPTHIYTEVASAFYLKRDKTNEIFCPSFSQLCPCSLFLRAARGAAAEERRRRNPAVEELPGPLLLRGGLPLERG